MLNMSSLTGDIFTDTSTNRINEPAIIIYNDFHTHAGRLGLDLRPA
jgi:hypothetical protein